MKTSKNITTICWMLAIIFSLWLTTTFTACHHDANSEDDTLRQDLSDMKSKKEKAKESDSIARKDTMELKESGQ